MDDRFDFDEDENKVGVSDIYRQYAEKSELENRLNEMMNNNSEEENVNNDISEEAEQIVLEEVKEEIGKQDVEKITEIANTLNENQGPNSNNANLVTFFASERGLEIYFADSNEVSFDVLYNALLEKIETIKYVYKDFRCGIVLKGRKFTDNEEEQIIIALRKNLYISIDYINTIGFYSDEVKKSKNDSKRDYAHTMYYHGTLRSGQALSCDSSLVIFGDVNPGSEVTAGGNLIVMGSLRGIVQAGLRSNDAYIVAFDMNPKQLRIGDHIARSADEGDDERIKKPHMAYIENDQIFIEPIEGTFNLIEKDC